MRSVGFVLAFTCGVFGCGGSSNTAPPDAGPPDAADLPPIPGLDIRFERATPEQLGLYVMLTDTIAPDATLDVNYRAVGEATWRPGHRLWRIHPGWSAGGAPVAPVDSFAGTIFDLRPGTTYELEVTLTTPGMEPQVTVVSASTRALPAAAGTSTATAAPGDDLQAKLAALTPGSVLELADGTYNVNGLYLDVAGTEDQPIYIRGQSRDGVVIRDTAGIVLQIRNGSHIVLEHLTLEGSGVDSGTNASSIAVSFWDGVTTPQEDVTFRDLDVRGVDMGIIGWGDVHSVLVYDSDLRGNNVWTVPFIESNLTWNDDGIRLPGQGNCAFQNTLRAFGDSFAVNDGVMSAAVYFYRNKVEMTGDDAFEADYGTRNIGFYDNHITNSGTLVSLDPVWGGPLYAFRNISINTMRGPFKLNNTNTGFAIYNNTMVRTEGRTGWGWVQFNNGDLRSWSYRNNLLVYRGGSQMLAIESSGNAPIDFTNNAWFPDGSVWWTNSGGSWTSFGAAQAKVPATQPLFGTASKRHEGDVILAADPFATSITLGADHRTEITTMYVPTLAADSPAIGAGVEIPNVTDGFSGAAPSIGAVISGREQPTWGAAR